jgi:hypothetical protein
LLKIDEVDGRLRDACRLGRDHGRQVGEAIERCAVRQCWRRWTDAAVEAYLEGAGGTQKNTRATAG